MGGTVKVWSYLPYWSPDMAAPPAELRPHICDLSVYGRSGTADRGVGGEAHGAGADEDAGAGCRRP
ncbi:hypothetical protein PYK79_26945 [Streptomyces sp. ID05-04B]|nr:hypothetical protein [Streptomyces sp. ID05-04B]